MRTVADLPPDFDLLSPTLWAERMPLAEFALLRRSAPIWFNARAADAKVFGDRGIWVASTHRDIRDISRDPASWSTHANGVIPAFADVADAASVEPSKALLINHDPPSHTRLRKLVSRLFSPRATAMLEDGLRAKARDIVESAAAAGGGNFVEQVAATLPIEAIAEMIGIPPADREQVFRWANSLIASTDDGVEGEDPVEASISLLGYAYEMADRRRRDPEDDILTVLVSAEVEGQALTPEEFGYFVLFLCVAGNETTRTATAHGMNAFLDHPDQWELFKRERPATTYDEVVRWSTPVAVTQRTALRDVGFGDVTIRSGERVALFYGSANFDETVFRDPARFDIRRDPNPHLGFGGSGPHICLGASLARLELRIILDAVADVMPDVTKLAEPRRLASSLVNGITHLDVRYR